MRMLLVRFTQDLLADIRSVVTHLRHDDGIEITTALDQIAASFPHRATHIRVRDRTRAILKAITWRII